MAYRRMIHIDFTDRDLFNMMPAEVQLTYIKLITHADDDGFVGKPISIARDCHADARAIDMLIEKGYLMYFDSGALLIKHWRVHNYIRKDRYHKTLYTKEREQVVLTEDKIYMLREEAEAAGVPLLDQSSDEEEQEEDSCDEPETEETSKSAEIHIACTSPTPLYA